MHLARDVYTLTAGDIALGVGNGCVGRTYHHQLKRFFSIGDPLNVADSPWPVPPKHRIRALQMLILRGGYIVPGVWITVWSITTPEHPDISTIILKEGVQSKHHLVKWQGDYPMSSGFEWRVYTGGVLAGDVGDILVAYE
jgi:hypothetical protein